MAAVDSDVTPTVGRKKFEVVETIAVTNAAATATKNRALMVPVWANSFICLLDITITGTTPLFDFAIYGGTTQAGRFGATLDSSLDKFDFAAAAPITITQLTTDTSSPVIALNVGPGVQTDTSGSATVSSAYAWSTSTLPTWLIYTYTYDGTTTDEDYNGTVSFIWGK